MDFESAQSIEDNGLYSAQDVQGARVREILVHVYLTNSPTREATFKSKRCSKLTIAVS